ncbi:hypothetical protein BKA83DRAFT_4126666 [Pisolithus microcarpus]|nr:hypothetical protein BKA83DRAFT_4126666 [Pisolithus microcarpus]
MSQCQFCGKLFKPQGIKSHEAHCGTCQIRASANLPPSVQNCPVLDSVPGPPDSSSKYWTGSDRIKQAQNRIKQAQTGSDRIKQDLGKWNMQFQKRQSASTMLLEPPNGT